MHAGVARTDLTPFWGVELTGWGYYIERRWQRVHDPLFATALACEANGVAAILITLDLMVIDADFTRRTRQMIREATGVPAESVMLTCSHSHNAPAAGGLRGVGECDPVYEDWASRQAATAAILAWQSREPAVIRTGHRQLNNVSFNRTRADGVVDARVTAARVDRADGTALAVIANFGAHPCVATELRPWDVSRDVPGVVCSDLEQTFPGAIAMYVQGACGDTNFLREFQTAERWQEPAHGVSEAAIAAIANAKRVEAPTVAAASRIAKLPTRRWTKEEIEHDQREAVRRMNSGDTAGWRETIGRAMTNRPEDMVKRHGGDELKAVRAMCRFNMEWTIQMMLDLESRPEVLETEVQALRIGDLTIVANSSEFFSPFALDVRRRAAVRDLMFACYANGRIGYLPDEHDIAAKSYAGFQSPKYCNQFPFTPESGPAMCDAMIDVIGKLGVGGEW